MNLPEPLRNLVNFVAIADHSPEAIRALLDYAVEQKKRFRAGQLEPSLQRKTLAMVFEKPSLRTRISFETAMVHLGGHAICLDQHHIGLGKREAVEDVARVTGRMCDGIMARTFRHEHVEALARYAGVPVINGLTDRLHPCQAMADMMTVLEHFADVAGRTLVFVGDGNNVARSLAWACFKLGANFVNVCPEPYQIEAELVEQLSRDAAGLTFERTDDVVGAVARADVIYTDTWVSMGQEDEKQRRQQDFADYQVNQQLVDRAPAHAVVMHCLPAYREVEITSEVLDSPRCIALDEAENRLHFQRALLEVLMAHGHTMRG